MASAGAPNAGQNSNSDDNVNSNPNINVHTNTNANTNTNTRPIPTAAARARSSLAAALAGAGAASPQSFRSVQFAGRGLGNGDSASSQVIDDGERDPYDNGSNRETDGWPPLHRRRSSVGARLSALTDIGGVNSIRSFTRSWQRAAGFTEVIPQQPSFVFAADQEPILGTGSGSYGRSFDAESGLGDRLTAGPPQPGSIAVTSSSENASLLVPPSETGSPALAPRDRQDSQDGNNSMLASENKPLLDADLSRAFRVGSASSIFAWPPHLASASGGGGSSGSPLAGSYGSYRSGAGLGSIDSAAGVSYGAMSARSRRSGSSQAASMAQAGALWQQQQQQHQEAGHNVPDGERPAILVKEVEEDGKIILTVEGQSTLPQTIFNSINVLIGVGLLSLPMGIKYAGWICGMVVLFLAAAVTSYTAGLLAKCMDLDPVVITFSDLAFISFGPRARLVTSILFTVELLAACVALIVLFADSLDLLFPGVLSVTTWKMVCCIVMVPLNFLPMRLLSVTSIIGIVSCFSIVSIVVIDGFTKKTTPGSLIQPAATYLFPANWLTLPLSFGLLMSPWGGHSVFPNIYRDMRHPYRYAQAVKVTFSFTYLLDTVTAVAGLLMFGEDVKDEITANLLTTSGYPRVLTVLLCIFIAIIPLTKIPLNARPIVTTVEVLAGLHQQSVAETPALVGRSMYFRGAAKIAIRVFTIVVFLVISILFPAFDSIMAFMGSALCFTICVTLPILFHLKLFGHELTAKDKMGQYVILTLSIVISVVGTVWSFLPKSLLGVV